MKLSFLQLDHHSFVYLLCTVRSSRARLWQQIVRKYTRERKRRIRTKRDTFTRAHFHYCRWSVPHTKSALATAGCGFPTQCVKPKAHFVSMEIEFSASLSHVIQKKPVYAYKSFGPHVPRIHVFLEWFDFQITHGRKISTLVHARSISSRECEMVTPVPRTYTQQNNKWGAVCFYDAGAFQAALRGRVCAL